jgi:hypothetical protein
VEPRPNPFLVASLLHDVGAQTQISFTLDTVVAVALVIFLTGFMLVDGAARAAWCT